MLRAAGKLLQWSAIVAAIVAAACSPALAQDVDEEKAARVKAAYVLNFARYTQWPESAFAAADSPIVVTEVGNCEVGDALAEVIARSEPIEQRRITLRRVAWSVDQDGAELAGILSQCHLLYLCPAEPLRTESILDRIDSAHVLTVGDTPYFTANGGMLGFVLQGSRIVFQANPKAIQNSSITVSAKVLKLAQIVEGEIP